MDHSITKWTDESTKRAVWLQVYIITIHIEIQLIHSRIFENEN